MILTDLVIILVLVIYAVIGYRRGFVSHVSELLGFILGFVIAFLLSHPIGGVLIEVINLPRSFADLAAFLAVWLAVELCSRWAPNGS
jgi:membrane protein required for colicin V production